VSWTQLAHADIVCMFICIFTLGCMSMDPVRRPLVGEEEISQDGPYMRALVAARLEQIWQTCRPHIDGTRQQEGWPADVRFVEVGLRTLKELGRLYRLDAPAGQSPELVSGVKASVRAAVEESLAILEARMADEVPR